MQVFLLLAAAVHVAVVSSVVAPFLLANFSRFDIWLQVSCASTEQRALIERYPPYQRLYHHVAGVLSPIEEDCATIVDAINIFSTNAANNFIVKADHTLMLAYGSSNYFFAYSGSVESDLLGHVPLHSACWPVKHVSHLSCLSLRRAFVRAWMEPGLLGVKFFAPLFFVVNDWKQGIAFLNVVRNTIRP
ncbi:uncharacterized protein BT62DRAFT_1010889 [Guyanagaster necrorhizus]|uniref:Uncharacterized protein n=1 Tax=Guyanagaster necrorhizus TaxID=856835 RepID=A0A9P8ANA5_9AGAR|nr:uncharacterized protein BT62DRAFT_1010889 [Guyanagaster necrorhizus MCA 3950]KAG7442113.1 hypothetical protein BT62DRAFT_1010889 [Guyanagaster necrorhizus MCA 3950]